MGDTNTITDVFGQGNFNLKTGAGYAYSLRWTQSCDSKYAASEIYY